MSPPPLGEVPVRFPWYSWIMEDLLDFSRAVLLVPPLFISILVFVSQSKFWFLKNPGWEVSDAGWISLSGLPVGGLGFLR